MHPLHNLPYEIHHIIFSHLPQSTLAQLCLLDRQSYNFCLPHLYRHVRISIRRQMIQLGNGLQRSSLLQQVVECHTKRLTLTTSQSSFQWLISNVQADWCRRWMPNLQTLIFCDFPILPVERIVSFLSRLVSLKSLCLRYCNLVCLQQPEAFIPMAPHDHSLVGIYQLPASYYYNHSEISTTASMSVSSVSSLHLDWTDFSPTAINHLLHNLPGLTHSFFGANHNRIANANTMALKALKQYCPHINALKIALQQACPEMVRQLIAHYGSQLLRLDIQCQETATLKTIAKYAKTVEWLAIHAVGTIQRQEQDMNDNGGGAWAFNRIKENEDDNNLTLHRTVPTTMHRNYRKQIELDGIERIVLECHQLIRMDMISWGFCAIPSVILLVMAYRQKQQQQQQQRQSYFFFTNNATTTRMGWGQSATIDLDSPILFSPPSTWSEKTSLALDRKTLVDIRNLFA